ncbi:MAG: serine/threonine protein kinase, partial [Myxococcus sp.]|nr:serine/threonine protein kinase [Myxococcus sp.]
MSGHSDTTARGRQQATPGPTGTVLCPACAKVLEGEPNFCNACGADLRGLGGSSDTFSGPNADKLIDGRYRILEKLGEGGMGSVYKVEHTRMGKIAALKVMRPDAAVDKGMKARFLQESRVVAKLSHANTVQVFDAGELDDGALFMAMEYVPGKDLAWHLKAHGPMSEEKVVSIGVQLLASLSEAHDHGIIHRDIKPANVMLVRTRKGGDDQVKLLDFGIAKLAEGDSRNSTTGEFIGTPAYMSPEQVRGDPVIDARSDLYSVGALLFELVTGRPLYTGPTAVSIVKQHLEEPIPRVADLAPQVPVTPAFENIIASALAKKVDERFADAESMRRALEALRKTVKNVTSDFTPMPEALAAKMLSREDFDRYERSLKTGRLLWPLAVVLLLGGAVTLGYWGLQHARANAGPADVEVEPNDQVQRATVIGLGRPVKGAIGAAGEGQGDRDLFVAQLASPGRYRVSLSGVPDLNLALEVLQLESRRAGDGAEAPPLEPAEKSAPTEKLRRKVFIDDVGVSEGERVDGLELAAGSVYLRVEERPFCTEPNRPPREKSLVPYTLLIEPMPAVEGLVESEPNDTPLTAGALPLTRAVTAWAGARLDDVEKLLLLRPDAPFSAIDTWRVDDVPVTEQVVVVVAPPERGALHVVDEAKLEAWRQRRAR